MHFPNEHPVERLLLRLAEAIYHHPRWFFYPQVALLALCLFYAGTHLELRSSRSDLVSADLKYEQDWQALKAEFPAQDDLVTLIESDDLEKNRQFVERLAARLEAETNLFKNVLYRGDLRRMGPKALLLLPEAPLEIVHRTLEEFAPMIRTFSDVTNLNSLVVEVNAQLREVEPEQATNQPLVRALPPLTRILRQATDSLQRPGVPPSPGLASLFAGTPETAAREYLSFASGRFYLVTCEPRDISRERAAIKRLRELVNETQSEVPGANAGVTGESVLNYDELRQARRDTLVASLVALVVVALTFIYGYHEIGRPLKATACLIVGIGYTLGFAALVVGHLNILTITFVPILIGLAIDFGVHLITRYEEELRSGRSERISLCKAIVCAGTGIFTSGLTTAAAFFAMALTDFKGVREMGIISGGGMLLCLVPMMTMLPVLLLPRRERSGEEREAERRKPASRRERIEQMWLARPRLVVLFSIVITAIACTQTFRVRFDYNLLNLQSQNLPAVAFEKKLIEASPKSLLFASIMADSPEEAVRLERELMQLETVADVDSLGPLLTENPERKLELVRAIKRVVEPFRFADPDTNAVNLDGLQPALESVFAYADAASEFVRRQGDENLAVQLEHLVEAIQRLRRELARTPSDIASAKLGAFQHTLFNDLKETITAIRNQDMSGPLRVEDLPNALRNRFIGRSGKILLQIYPRENVWEREHQREFVRELLTVDPHVTGSPVRFYEYTALLKRSFQKAAAYALGAIVLMVLLHFRSVTGVMLALLPVLLGILWMIGMMSLLGVSFNPANIMSLTLVIGIGVTSGIHLLNRFAEEKQPSILGKSTGKAVVVSALTTMAGFGSLMLAKHQGIASLGQVMAIGTGMCMIASLTVLPALLILLSRVGWRMNRK